MRHPSRDLVEPLDAAVRRHDAVVLPYEFARGSAAVPLFEDTWTCVTAASDEVIPDILDRELAARHSWVLVQTGPLGEAIGFPELRALGVRPRVVLRIDQFLSVPAALSGTDHLSVVPKRLAVSHMAFGGLRSLPCPWPVRPHRLALHWHPALEQDSGHRWFRQLARQVATTL